MPQYRITSGSFREPDDSIKGTGDTIEMGEDVAALHPTRLQLLPDAQAVEKTPLDMPTLQVKD